MPTGQEQERPKKEAGPHQAGKPKVYKQGDIRKSDIKAQENLDAARKNQTNLQAEYDRIKEGAPGFPKGGTRHTKKMDKLEKDLLAAGDRLARREKEMENLQMGHGFGRGEKQGLGRQHSAEATQNLHEGKPARGRSPTASPRFTDIHTATPTPVSLGGAQTMAPDVQTQAEMGYIPVGGGAPLPPAPAPPPTEQQEEVKPKHCPKHLYFRKSCKACLEIVA